MAFKDNLLSRLAEDLLARTGAADQGDLSGALVILPSARACRALGHILLEKSGRETLLLPGAVTPKQLLEEEAVAQGLNTASLPDDSIRSLVLAHHLENLPWLKDHQENGPGLAREFVAFFDEARLYGRSDLLQGSSALEAVLTRGDSAEGEVLSGDVLRIGEVWNIYRQAVPRDGVDLLLEAAAGAADRPRRRMEFLAVAGFARLDPAGAALIRAQALGAETAILYQPGSGSLLSRFFTCTWGPGSSGLDPLAPSRLVARRLEPEPPSDVDQLPEGSLRQRLDALGDTSGLWQPEGSLELAACADQEQESLLITDRVVQLLGEPQGNQKSIIVAANDPLLAARVVAQLRDAGIDVDNTLGQPLSTLPAGLLLRFILRAALTGLRPEPLLEILTHPYTRIGGAETRQEISTLRLEKKLREQDVLPAGPEALLRLARENDEAARTAFGTDTHELEDFVSAVVTAFQPLLATGSGTATVAGFLKALRQTWSALAPDHRLKEDKSQADLTAADRMLNRLEKDVAWLPESTLASFTADLNRLLASENVPPHRSTGLPVMVAGLVEARLEKCDHLIIAGMNEGKFPTKGTRPLFLNARVRTRLDLPGWKETLARDAELFLRLLHNAPQVLVTWSVEEGGRPLLPSPFVERLKLGLPAEAKIEISAPAPQWRRHSDPLAEIAAGQKAFRDESLAVPALARSRDLNRLSWTALRHWRECPYRFLLERGFALRKEEEVQEEFGRRDSGNLIHEIMHDFLEPGGPGCQALAEGKAGQAAELLEMEARKKFMPQGQTLPGRALWLGSFLRWIPGVIEYEIDRYQQWRPVDLEPRFSLPLPDLVTWMAEQVNLGEVTGDVPQLTPDQAAIVLEGAIDRVDAAVGSTAIAVIDYKTGKVPPLKQVTELRELQVLLYALAVEGKALDLAGIDHRVSEAFYYAIGEDAVGMAGKAHFQGDRQILFDAAAQLVEMARAAAKAEGPFPLIPEERNGEGPATLPCGYCSFRGSCRLEERVGLPPATEVKLDKLVSRKEGGLF